MKIRGKTALAMLAMTMIASSPAIAQGLLQSPAQGRGIGMNRSLRLLGPEAVEELGITADQTAKIRQQESDFRKAQIRNQADLRVKQIELQELLAAENPDRGDINRKLEDVSDARLAMERSAIDNRLTLRETLTAEQRQKIEQMRNEARQQRRQRFQQFRRGAPQGSGRPGRRFRQGPRRDGPQGQQQQPDNG